MEESTSLWARLRASLRLTRRALGLIWSICPTLLLLLLTLVALQSVLPALGLALSKLVIDRAGADLGLVVQPDPLALRMPLAVWIGAAALSLSLGQALLALAATVQSLIGDRVSVATARALMLATASWPGLRQIEDPALADEIQRARQGSSGQSVFMLIAIATFATDLATLLALGGVLLRLGPLVPLGLLLATLPLLRARWSYGQQTERHLYERTDIARRLQYYRQLSLAPAEAKDVRLYTMAPFLARCYGEAFDAVFGSVQQLRRRLGWRVACWSLLAAASLGAVYGYTVWRVWQGALTPGDLLLYGGAATLFAQGLGRIELALGIVPHALAFVESYLRVLDTPPDIAPPAQPLPPPRPVRSGIVFENVHFTYPGQPAPTLRGVSFALGPGESLALVGPNGAGKTTLVKLLLRMYEPTSGRILLDGVDLRDYDLAALRRQLSVIFQDFARYELTAAENIGLGAVAALDDAPRIARAAAQGGADTLIAQLPAGGATRLGRLFGERELSGGEWQKLALARAFMRDAQLLVLDEPTAALDVQTEYEVYTRFRELTRGRMTLLISHRFSTVRMADRIVYLEQGQVQESGTHADLLARQGEYARLYHQQAAHYGDAEAEP